MRQYWEIRLQIISGQRSKSVGRTHFSEANNCRIVHSKVKRIYLEKNMTKAVDSTSTNSISYFSFTSRTTIPTDDKNDK